VLAKMLDTLLCLLTPVLPFTAEEAYLAAKARLGKTETSALLLTLKTLSLPEVPEEAVLGRVFGELAELKREANRLAESLRGEGVKSVVQLELTVTVPEGCAWVTEAVLLNYLGCSSVNKLAGGRFELSGGVATQRCACPRCRQFVVVLTEQLCQRCDEVEAAATNGQPLTT
jgi:hypothetical protein